MLTKIAWIKMKTLIFLILLFCTINLANAEEKEFVLKIKWSDNRARAFPKLEPPEIIGTYDLSIFSPSQIKISCADEENFALHWKANEIEQYSLNKIYLRFQPNSSFGDPDHIELKSNAGNYFVSKSLLKEKHLAMENEFQKAKTSNEEQCKTQRENARRTLFGRIFFLEPEVCSRNISQASYEQRLASELAFEVMNLAVEYNFDKKLYSKRFSPSIRRQYGKIKWLERECKMFER